MNKLTSLNLEQGAPILSVLLPVYNAEKYLVAAIESILQQTYSNFYFIIINDGSTDNSLNILQSFAKNDDRIQLISRDNKGLVYTLNEGLALIKTPYVARMDADDIALPTRFEKQMDYILNNNDCLLLGSRVIIIDSDGDEICEMGDYFSHDEIDQGLLEKKGQLIYHPSIIFQKKIIDQLGGYRGKYPHVEDLDLFLRVSEQGKVENLKEPLLKYREHTTKVGHLHYKEQMSEINDVIKETFYRRNLPYSETPLNFSNAIGEVDRWRTWGWWALNSGNTKTAKKYMLKLIFSSPLSLDSWRLLYCVIRGY
jgi:glycosyltransferase involved in cell wall biosynthesis